MFKLAVYCVVVLCGETANLCPQGWIRFQMNFLLGPKLRTAGVLKRSTVSWRP